MRTFSDITNFPARRRLSTTSGVMSTIRTTITRTNGFDGAGIVRLISSGFQIFQCYESEAMIAILFAKIYDRERGAWLTPQISSSIYKVFIIKEWVVNLRHNTSWKFHAGKYAARKKKNFSAVFEAMRPYYRNIKIDTLYRTIFLVEQDGTFFFVAKVSFRLSLKCRLILLGQLRVMSYRKIWEPLNRCVCHVGASVRQVWRGGRGKASR